MAITANELPTTVALAGNPMYADISTDEYAEDFIGLHLNPEVYIDSAWVSASQEMRFEPDSAHKAIVDIHRLLQWDPEKEFTFPESCGTLLVKRNNLRRQWRLKYSEKYGNPLAAYNLTTSSVRYILPGKISDKKQGQYNDSSTDWWTKLQSEKWFLSNSPRTKTTDAWASERLYYFVFGSGVTGINLNVKITYTDGENESFIRSTIGSVAQYDVYEIITSFSTLGIFLTDQSKIVQKYEIWLTSQATTVISEVMTYTMDHKKKPDTRYFIFANAYKMYEGIRMTGKTSEESSVDFITAERDLEKDYAASDRTVIREMIKDQHIVTSNSGWLTTEEMQWYRELLLSKEVYEIVDGIIVPVSIISNKVIINNDQTNLRNIQIVYQYAYSDSVPDMHDAVEDGYDAFSAGIDLITAMYNDSFAVFSYSSGDITAAEVASNEGRAESNPLAIGFVPIIFKYSNVTNDYAALEASLSVNETDVNEVDSVVIGADGEVTVSGYGLMYSKHPDADDDKQIEIRKQSIDDEVDTSVTIEAKYASKRYLEYLYENE